jgi:mRNA interferase MazF
MMNRSSALGFCYFGAVKQNPAEKNCLAGLPGNMLLEKAVSGLDKSSVINFSQIITIDRSDLTELVAMLPRGTLQKVAARIKQVLDIT